MMTRSLIFIVALVLCGVVRAEEQHYLFSYFTNNGEDGLHLAHSTDGYNWQNIKGGESLLTPTAGVDKLLRDPSIVQGPDGTFHMVWTVSWKERSIGYSSSKDLINWAPQQTLPVMEHEPTAENCWAPEIFYDAATNQFYVLWATTIPGRFPETEGKKSDPNAPTDHNHRIFYFTTPDFKQISDTQLYYDGGFNVIDTALLKTGERYALFLKDETNIPGAREKYPRGVRPLGDGSVRDCERKNHRRLLGRRPLAVASRRPCAGLLR